jgi:hypothetical protein
VFSFLFDCAWNDCDITYVIYYYFAMAKPADFAWIPNDLHRALKWGIRATLQLSQYGAELLQIMFDIWLMCPCL